MVIIFTGLFYKIILHTIYFFVWFTLLLREAMKVALNVLIFLKVIFLNFYQIISNCVY